MHKINLKLVMGKIQLMYVILFCCLLTSENVFSRKHWEKDDMKVLFCPKLGYISFEPLFYDYLEAKDEHGFLENCCISYSVDGERYTDLIKTSTKDQKGTNELSISLWYKKIGEEVHVRDPNRNRSKSTILYDLKPIVFNGVVIKREYNDGKNNVTSKRSILLFYWDCTKLTNQIKSVKITGLWKTNDKSGGDKIDLDYQLFSVKSNSNTMKNTPSELKSEISNEVKVARQADAIVVAGVEPGEDIKVYTATGEELKSVVAHDDVVNIKLPKNQIYIVNTGKARYKVAL